MKMAYTHITITAYFPTVILNWQVLRGKEKYLLNSLYEKLKNKFSLSSLSRTNKQIKGQMYGSNFLNSKKFEDPEKF